MRIFIIITFAFLSYCAKGQTLSLDDIFNVRLMDSTELRTFAYEKGFKFKRTDSKDYGGNKFIHNIYLTKDNEIDLASEELLGQKMKYTLMYYRRIN